MFNRKDRPTRLYDVLLVVVSHWDAGGGNCTSHRVAQVLGLKPSSYIRGLLSDLVGAEYLQATPLRERFGHAVLGYYPTQPGREILQHNKYLGALFLMNKSNVKQGKWEL